MKKKFIFDKAENDIADIDELTVIKNTGVDSARVKESVMKEIRDENKPEKKTNKKSLKKIFSIVAIAAAVAAAASLTTMAATGFLNPAFGELFAGQPANGIFPGADISVNSTDYNIEFIGVTGDETEMFSIYDITKKDGSNFVDTKDNYCFLGTNADMDITESPYKLMKASLDGGRGRGSGVSYEFADEKTIRAVVSYSDTAGCIKGERLTVKDTETTFYHIDDVLYSDASSTLEGCLNFMDENKKLLDEKEASLSKDQFILPVSLDGRSKVVVVTMKTIPMEYELGVKLNYKTAEKTFSEAEGRTFNALNTEWKIKSIKAGSFGIKINAATDENNVYAGFDMENMENWSSEKLHDYFNVSTDISIEITLKDGTKVNAIGMSCSSSKDHGYGESTWECNYILEGSSSAMYALDSNDIVSIVCNGTELIG